MKKVTSSGDKGIDVRQKANVPDGATVTPLRQRNATLAWSDSRSPGTRRRALEAPDATSLRMATVCWRRVGRRPPSDSRRLRWLAGSVQANSSRRSEEKSHG